MSDGATIARPYAEALFQISLDEGEKFGDELNFLATVLRDKNLNSYLLNPVSYTHLTLPTICSV